MIGVCGVSVVLPVAMEHTFANVIASFPPIVTVKDAEEMQQPGNTADRNVVK